MANNGDNILVGIVLVVLWIGIKLPLLACYYAAIVLVVVMRTLVKGTRVGYLHGLRAYLLYKARH